MEGFLGRLLDKSDAVARKLLSKCDFYVVPNLNLDGSVRGYLRTNAAGKNLNREWKTPSAETSPEVYHCQASMRQTGCDFCLDVHSEEELEYVFLSKTVSFFFYIFVECVSARSRIFVYFTATWNPES